MKTSPVPGASGSATIKVDETKGRAASFEVEGHDGVDTVCRAKHTRFVVDVATTRQRLATKAQKAGLQGTP